MEDLAGTKGILRELLHSGNDVLTRSAVQCVENLCIRYRTMRISSQNSQNMCNVFYLMNVMHALRCLLLRNANGFVCFRVPNQPYLSGESQALCLSLFIDVLHTTKAINPDDINQCKVCLTRIIDLRLLPKSIMPKNG